MADHFARAAGFAGDETTEASVMPGGSGRPGYNLDNTMDTDTHAFTGILQPAQQQRMAMPPPLVPASKVVDGNNNRENVAADNRPSGAKVNGFTTTNNAASVRIPASRVPLQPSSPANSRPSSSQSQQRAPSALAASAAQQLDTDEDDSEDELGARPNATLANETTMASAADASEWERHIRESKNKAGVSIKQMQQRIDHLLQERDDLKIEVDILRRNYNPDDQAAELIRLRQENIRITNHRITLSELLTAQKKTIKDLQKQAKHMSSQPGPNDREAKRRLDELEDTVRLLDEQKEEEAQARLKAEEEIAKLRADLEASQKECNDLGAEREDMDQDFYRLEKERDAAEDKAAELAREREDWERERQEWEERLVELERGAQQRADETAADQLAIDERQEECERLERELEGRMDELHKTQMELQDVRGQLEASAAEVAVFRGEVDAQNGAHEDKVSEIGSAANQPECRIDIDSTRPLYSTMPSVMSWQQRRTNYCSSRKSTRRWSQHASKTKKRLQSWERASTMWFANWKRKKPRSSSAIARLRNRARPFVVWRKSKKPAWQMRTRPIKYAPRQRRSLRHSVNTTR